MRASTTLLTLTASLINSAASQQLAQDPGTAGPPLEIAHIYKNEFPGGKC